MALTKRSVKGSALTYAELDGNFTHLGGDGTYHDGGMRVGGYRPGEVIEKLAGVCDGRSVTVHSGTYTFSNVTAVQPLTTTFTSAQAGVTYTPPAGTNVVIYEVSFQWRFNDVDPIFHTKVQLDGVDVPGSYTTTRPNIGDVATGNQEFREHHMAVIDASSWTTAKLVDLVAREYGGSYEASLHSTNLSDGVGTDLIVPPTVIITAIA